MAYNSLKDFYDIYEVAALKWKVSVRTRQKTREGAGLIAWGGGVVAGRTGGPTPSRWSSSALGLPPHPPTAGLQVAICVPLHLPCSLPIKSTESQVDRSSYCVTSGKCWNLFKPCPTWEMG